MVSLRVLLFSLGLCQLGCQLPYILKSGYEQSKILAQRESLEKVLHKDSIPEEVKSKIRLAQEAKVFAETKLGLTPTDNYSSYVDLNRPYVSWIVQAAKAYELKPYLWDFPLVGELPYKGFFSPEAAKQEAQSFDPLKYDTYIRGVTAYSTLGWFNDPLLNTMMTYSEPDLVELIIHESVHATLYIKSQADFNERLATYLGQLGAERFYLYKEGEDSPTVKRIRAERQDQQLFSRFLSKELQLLEEWYAASETHRTPEAKEERLRALQVKYREEIVPQLKTPSLQKALEGELNNARLIALKTYQMDLEDFEKLYLKLDRDIAAFLAACKRLEEAEDPVQKLKDLLKPGG